LPLPNPQAKSGSTPTAVSITRLDVGTAKPRQGNL
jgi:hypothetical protein